MLGLVACGAFPSRIVLFATGHSGMLLMPRLVRACAVVRRGSFGLLMGLSEEPNMLPGTAPHCIVSSLLQFGTLRRQTARWSSCRTRTAHCENERDAFRFATTSSCHLSLHACGCGSTAASVLPLGVNGAGACRKRLLIHSAHFAQVCAVQQFT